MENYLMINGKKITITEEVVKQLTEIINNNKNCWDRKEVGETYYTIHNSRLMPIVEDNDSDDSSYFNIANYCSDKEKMQRIQLEQNLKRKLERYRDLNNDYIEDWNYEKFYVCYDKDSNEWKMESMFNPNRDLGVIYFKSKNICENALIRFKVDFNNLIDFYFKD